MRAASVPSGSAPGCSTQIVQPVTSGRAPARSAGTSPARTSEDLPLPEAPTTARKRARLSISTSRCTSRSRPKNSFASSSPNGCRPRYGVSPVLGSIATDGPNGTPLTAAMRSCSARSLLVATAVVHPRASPQEVREDRGVERLAHARQQDREHPEVALPGRAVKRERELLQPPRTEIAGTNEDGTRARGLDASSQLLLPLAAGRLRPLVKPGL